MTARHENAALPAPLSELWSLREDVNVECESTGDVRLHGRWGQITVRRAAEPVREALRRMRLGPISLANVLSGAPPGDAASDADRPELYRVLEELQPFIVRSLGLASGQPVLSVVPLSVTTRFRPTPLDGEALVRLSSFAALRTNGVEYSIESALALYRVVLHRAEAVALIGSLSRPVTPRMCAAAVPSLGETAASVLGYLAAAGMLVSATGPGEVSREDADPALLGWSATDLMFHARSTLGRHDNDFGITYPTGEAECAEPVVKQRAGRSIPLHRPDWDALCAADPPLTAAIEARRSIRRYAARPVTISQLGDLLYRAARVRALIPGAPGRKGGELSDRPYPSSGACHELELYLAVGECSGLARGIYHYDPLGHRLELVTADEGVLANLLACARVATAMAGPPPVVITITARFRRLSWKYEGLPYRLMLLNAGVLIQTLYLICTAMHLAPCAIGGTSSELVARACGTDWRVEPCVAHFMIGPEPDDTGPDDAEPGCGAWQAANDAGWRNLSRSVRVR
jgi:SagB-type dehydrogenase family enzyme